MHFNNHQKVFSIFVNYFDKKLGLSVVQHYKSISMIEVNALTLFKEICELFQADQIPFENLVFDLTNCMGSNEGGLKSDLEIKPHTF